MRRTGSGNYFDKIGKNWLILEMSALLTASDISLVVAHRTLLDQVSFQINTGEIVGIVGRNGSGKSSLLKLVAGVWQLDDGQMQFRNNLKIGYLAQDFDLDENQTVWQVLEKAYLSQNQNGEEISLKQNQFSDQHFNKQVKQVSNQHQDFEFKRIELPKLGAENNLQADFADKMTREIQKIVDDLGFGQGLISQLSGGQKRKLALAQILLQRPDLLILDEPTNHLDITTLEKLEKTLKNFVNGQCSVLLVSHDRYFLDQLATRILEIFDGQIYSHPGNYQAFVKNKKLRMEIASTTEARRQGFLRTELKWVRAGVKARGTKDKGRLERFEEIKNQKDFENETAIQLLLPKIRPLGKKIINLEDVVLTVGDKKIVSGLSFDFQAKTVLGLVGPNGSGKTSLIKAILGELKIQSGQIVVGDNTIFNYQDQHKWNLDPDKTIFAEMAENQETMAFGEATISSRAYLRKLDFSGEQILTHIKNLSGGQKTRLILAKILKEGGNCLILDEPTNDLDLETIELLEKSILEFEGVCIIVSHDRYFLNQVCNHILSLEDNGNFILSTGNFDDFAAKKQLETEPDYFKTPAKLQKTDYQFQKQKQKDLQKCESQITKLESTIKALESEFAKPDFYQSAKYPKISQQLENSQTTLAKLLEKWESLSQ